MEAISFCWWKQDCAVEILVSRKQECPVEIFLQVNKTALLKFLLQENKTALLKFLWQENKTALLKFLLQENKTALFKNSCYKKTRLPCWNSWGLSSADGTTVQAPLPELFCSHEEADTQ